MRDNTITINEKEYQIMTTFFLEKFKKNYVVYSEDLNKENPKFIINTYEGNLEDCLLGEVKTEEEWVIIENFLKDMLISK